MMAIETIASSRCDTTEGSLMQIGYARISTHDQNLALQDDALNACGCEKIFSDVASGAATVRAGLADALTHLRAGDVLVVWRLDRLGRSLKDLIETVTTLQSRGVGFRSLTEGIETETSGGRLVFHLFACLAEFERSVIKERTLAGLAAARARGRRGGRPAALDAEEIALARRMHADSANSAADICRALGVSRATLYRYLKTKPTLPPLSPTVHYAAKRLLDVDP
jgi:DNA invertase Pin-like site-specific DNA recombinase